ESLEYSSVLVLCDGTTSLYTLLATEERGKNVIRVYKTITCSMKGKNDVISTLEEKLKIEVGQTTPDKMFTLLETNCIGWCHKAPAMLVNDMPYTDLSSETVIDVIKGYMRK